MFWIIAATAKVLDLGVSKITCVLSQFVNVAFCNKTVAFRNKKPDVFCNKLLSHFCNKIVAAFCNKLS